MKNHIGTFHPIAMCKMPEVAGGMLPELPLRGATHGWIPRDMPVEDSTKPGTTLRASPNINPTPKLGVRQPEVQVECKVFDTRDQLVFRAVITMWVTPKK